MSRTASTETDDDMIYAVGLYALGEINEGKAAEIAGVTRWDMREILTDAGLDLRLGPRDMDELRRDVDVAMSLGEVSDDNGEE